MVADMMFGRGATRLDREMLRAKAAALAARGLPDGGGSLKTSPGAGYLSRIRFSPHNQPCYLYEAFSEQCERGGATTLKLIL